MRLAFLWLVLLLAGCVDYGIPDEIFACRPGPSSSAECGDDQLCSRGSGCYCICGAPKMFCSDILNQDGSIQKEVKVGDRRVPCGDGLAPCETGSTCAPRADADLACADPDCQTPD